MKTCPDCGCSQDDLDSAMEFDHPVRVAADGTLHDRMPGVYAPELIMDVDGDGQILDSHETDYVAQAKRQGWQLLTGWTGQHGYRGVVMHPSEFVGGGLADHIRETPGTYVLIAVETADDSEDAAGWAICYRPDPEPDETGMKTDLGAASNMFGSLGDEPRARLQAVLDDPTEATWGDAHSIILNTEGLGTTLWQAVCAIDPSYTATGPTSRWVEDSSPLGGHSEPVTGWARIPSRELLAQAVNYATR